MQTRADLTLARKVLRGEYDPVAEPDAAGKALDVLLSLIDGELERLDAPPPPPPPRPSEPVTSVEVPHPAPASATVSGSGGPQNAYDAPMTTHPSSVGTCPDCGGQLQHVPTCPRLTPRRKATP